MDGPVVAWRPAEWDEGDRGYAVSVSRSGVLIGEVYLHEIPSWVLVNANRAWEQLKSGNEDEVLSMVTHQRVRRGAKWRLLPIQKEEVNAAA